MVVVAINTNKIVLVEDPASLRDHHRAGCGVFFSVRVVDNERRRISTK